MVAYTPSMQAACAIYLSMRSSDGPNWVSEWTQRD